MRQIPSGEFTKSPGQYLEQVVRGEVIMLTRYGRPWVLLSPPSPEDIEQMNKAAGDTQ